MLAQPLVLELFAALSLVIWLILFFAWGNFWQTWNSDDDHARFPALPQWPPVIAVIPARNEAGSVAPVVEAIVKQDYPGKLSIIVVDDHSEDGTAEIAKGAAITAGHIHPVSVIPAPPLQPGWTGKLWALNAGVCSAGESLKTDAGAAEFFWFTDADILHPRNTLTKLVARAEANALDLTSLMVQLQSETAAETLLIPAFLYFFLMLYPPKWIADPSSKTAGAAGGCILLRRTALERIGGLAAIRIAVIDDCALARAVKRSGGKIWMGLTRASHSLRSYTTFSEIRDMIARTAFTQLRYSVLLLLGTLMGLTLTFLLPVALTLSPNIRVWPFALAAWCLMTASFLPTVTFYKKSPLWAPLLPLAALFYSYATVLSALRYWQGRGAQWKGRAQASQAPDRGDSA